MYVCMILVWDSQPHDCHHNVALYSLLADIWEEISWPPPPIKLVWSASCCVAYAHAVSHSVCICLCFPNTCMIGALCHSTSWCIFLIHWSHACWVGRYQRYIFQVCCRHESPLNSIGLHWPLMLLLNFVSCTLAATLRIVLPAWMHTQTRLCGEIFFSNSPVLACWLR